LGKFWGNFWAGKLGGGIFVLRAGPAKKCPQWLENAKEVAQKYILPHEAHWGRMGKILLLAKDLSGVKVQKINDKIKGVNVKVR